MYKHPRLPLVFDVWRAAGEIRALFDYINTTLLA